MGEDECSRKRTTYVQVGRCSIHQIESIIRSIMLSSRLADLMEEHKEELATLESLDSGAVYTLALKTHIGFSIDTFRYFAGWCDKIQVHVLHVEVLQYYL